MIEKLMAIVLFGSVLSSSAPSLAEDLTGVEGRKRAFLTRLADDWLRAGAPIQWPHDEWKFDEIEPNWAGALAAMFLKRSPAEIEQANAFFEAMPIDTKIDPDMRVCEAQHAYYLFRDSPDLTPAARKRLLEIFRFEPAPRRLNASVWDFGATENHALMGHVWALLTAQLDRDRKTVGEIGRHVEAYITEHIRKGWLEYNSPCYVEKDAGCLVMLSEWAEDPILRQKAKLGLDVLFAEHAALSLDGMLGGPACRVYRPSFDGILPAELGHNSRFDAKCSGSYPMMYLLFGQGEPHFYGVLGAAVLATSTYEAPAAVSALATGGEQRGSYEFKARRPGSGHRFLRQNPGTAVPPDEVFNGRVYTWMTPDFALGSFQQVEGRFSAARSLPVISVLRMAGSTRRAILTDLLPGERRQDLVARADCFQHKNVSMGRGSAGRAYLATREFDELVEDGGWIFVRAGKTFAAYRVVGSGYQWEHCGDPGLYGDFIRFERPDAAFILEAVRASEYGHDFARFRADVADNRVEEDGNRVTYHSCSAGDAGPSGESFTLTLQPGDLPLVDGRPVRLDQYGTFESPYLNSAWDSGITFLRFGPYRLTVNVKPRVPVSVEEVIPAVELPYETTCDEPSSAWAPFLNYWRLNAEQWYWDKANGRTGGCLRHDLARGVAKPERGAHDAAIMLGGGQHWTDYAFQADAYTDKGSLGLWVRADMQSEGGGNGRWVQGYYFMLTPSRGDYRLWRARQDGVLSPGENGKPEPEQNHFSNPFLLAQVKLPGSVAPGKWIHLEMRVKGDEITCLVDGKQVLTAKDRLYPSGSVGFNTYKGEGVRFDNIKVTPLR